MPRPRTKPAPVPQPFRARYDPQRGRWGVMQGLRWRYADEICIQVTVANEGVHLTGVGVVHTTKRGTIVITA